MLLDDTLVNEIERSLDPRLAQSRQILTRLRRRDLYRCADQIHVPTDLCHAIDKSQISASEIIRHDVENEGEPLLEQDVIVEWLTLNFAMSDRNPLDFIRFFTKYAPDQPIQIPKEHISSFIPNHYKEIIIRVFVRDPLKAHRVQEAFRKFLKTINETLFEQISEENSPNAHPTLQDQARGSAPSTPLIDATGANPFYVPNSTGKISISSSRSGFSRNASPTKAILEPSAGSTLPKNFSEIIEDSPVRKRKRVIVPMDTK